MLLARDPELDSGDYAINNEQLRKPQTDSISNNTDQYAWYNLSDTLETIIDSIKWEYYKKLKKAFNTTNQDSEGIRSCLSRFYSSIEPVAVYGSPPPSQGNTQTSVSTQKNIEKVTCNDGTIINEKAYNLAEKNLAEAKAEFDQSIANSEYCFKKRIYDLINSCNTANKSETPLSEDPPDTTKVSKDVLYYEDTCEYYNSNLKF